MDRAHLVTPVFKAAAQTNDKLDFGRSTGHVFKGSTASVDGARVLVSRTGGVMISLGNGPVNV